MAAANGWACCPGFPSCFLAPLSPPLQWYHLGSCPTPFWPAEPLHACSQLATAHRYLSLKWGHQRPAHGVIQTGLHTSHISRTLGLLSPYPSVSLPFSLSLFLPLHLSFSLYMYLSPLPLPFFLRSSCSCSLKQEVGIRVLVPP